MPQITINGRTTASKLRKGSLERNMWAIAANMAQALPATCTHITLSYTRTHNTGTLQLLGKYSNGAQWQIDMQPEAWLFYRRTPPRLAAIMMTASCMLRLHEQSVLHDLEPVYEVDP